MSDSKILVVFLLQFAVLVCSTDVGSNNSLIHTTCARMESKYDQNLCLSTLLSDPRTNLTSSLKGFASIFIQKAIENATDTISFMEELMKTHTDNSTKQSLQGCCDDFQLSINEVNRHMDGFENLEDLAEYVDYMGGDGEVCQMVDFEIDGVKVPKGIIERGRNLEEWCILASGIIRLMQCDRVRSCP